MKGEEGVDVGVSQTQGSRRNPEFLLIGLGQGGGSGLDGRGVHSHRFLVPACLAKLG